MVVFAAEGLRAVRTGCRAVEARVHIVLEKRQCTCVVRRHRRTCFLIVIAVVRVSRQHLGLTFCEIRRFQTWYDRTYLENQLTQQIAAMKGRPFIVYAFGRF